MKFRKHSYEDREQFGSGIGSVSEIIPAGKGLEVGLSQAGNGLEFQADAVGEVFLLGIEKLFGCALQISGSLPSLVDPRGCIELQRRQLLQRLLMRGVELRARSTRGGFLRSSQVSVEVEVEKPSPAFIGARASRASPAWAPRSARPKRWTRGTRARR